MLLLLSPVSRRYRTARSPRAELAQIYAYLEAAPGISFSVLRCPSTSLGLASPTHLRQLRACQILCTKLQVALHRVLEVGQAQRPCCCCCCCCYCSCCGRQCYRRARCRRQHGDMPAIAGLEPRKRVQTPPRIRRHVGRRESGHVLHQKRSAYAPAPVEVSYRAERCLSS